MSSGWQISVYRCEYMKQRVSKAILMVIMCMSFSIQITVNLLLPTPVCIYKYIFCIKLEAEMGFAQR